MRKSSRVEKEANRRLGTGEKMMGSEEDRMRGASRLLIPSVEAGLNEDERGRKGDRRAKLRDSAKLSYLRYIHSQGGRRSVGMRTHTHTLYIFLE